MSHRYSLQAISSARREEWDQFVNTHSQGHLLQSWAWGELKTSSTWHPIRLALWDTEETRIVAAAQVLRRTAPHTPAQLGHLAYIPKGPVVDWSQTALSKILFMQLNDYLRHHGALALRLEPNVLEDSPEHVCVSETLAALQFGAARSVQPLRTIMLDVTPDEDTLLARMKEKWRYNVRLAARKGIQVRLASSEDDVRAWYRIMETTSSRDEFGIHTEEYYVRAWHLLTANDKGRLFLAEHEGQLLAGIFVTLFGGEGIYLYGASSNEKRNLMPNHLLQWEAIRWIKQQGATRYDFWGIPDTDDSEESMAGVYRFKQGWGGNVVRFAGGFEREYQPLVMKTVKRFISF